MKRNAWQICGVVAAFAAIVILAIAGGRAQQSQFSFFSTYDTGRYGYRALYGVLQAQNVPVLRFERELGLLDSNVGTLVISWSAPAERHGVAGDAIDRSDALRLRAFVQKGGRLVVLDEGPSALLDVLGAGGAERRSYGVTARPVVRVNAASGVDTVWATSATFYPFGSHLDAVPLLANRSGIVALQRRIGRGDVIAIAAPTIFSNANLARAANARFAYGVLASHGPVAFDERVHGYQQDKSMWEALPAPVRAGVWLVVAIVLLWLVDGNVRVAPAVSIEPPDERDSSAYIASMAALLRRNRAVSWAIAGFAADAARRHGRRRDREDVAAALRELDYLRDLTKPSDEALIRAAQLDAILRKDHG